MRTLNSKINNTQKAAFELEKYVGIELNGLDIFIFSTYTFIYLLLIFLRYHIMLCGLSNNEGKTKRFVVNRRLNPTWFYCSDINLRYVFYFIAIHLFSMCNG